MGGPVGALLVVLTPAPLFWLGLVLLGGAVVIGFLDGYSGWSD